MKKLFSLVASLLLVFTFTACDSSSLQSTVSQLETQVSQLEAQIADLEADKAALETEKATLIAEKADLTTELANVNAALTNKTSELETLMSIKAALDTENADLDSQIETLEAEKVALEAQIETILTAATKTLGFDNVVLFIIEEETGSLYKFVGYDDTYVGSLFDLLDANFDVDSTESTYGHMINALESLNPLNGQYISFMINGEYAMTGVDSTTLNHGDIYTFELAWWDMTEKAVSDGIELFLDNYAAQLVNATSIDYTTAAALSHLGVLNDYVTNEEINTYVEGLTLTTWNDYVKAILILEAAGIDATTLYTALNDIAAPAGFGGTGYQLNTFAANVTAIDYSTFETAALADLAATTPVTLGIDSGAPCILALSNYTSETGVDTLINDWVSFIKTNQTEDGKVLDKDFGWGQSESGATMAQAIMGLVSVGVNPKGADAAGTDMTQLNYDLVAGMTSLADENGAYLGWDGNPDLGFSTPQAFLALVTYQIYSNNGMNPVNPYSFEPEL